MASTLFMIFEDIASLMDDIAVNTKIAAKQTAGVLGDDLAVNAAKASNFESSRELPVLWAITKGSFINKIIIIPIIIALSIYLPNIIVPILLLGGLYLSFEGAEGLWHLLFPEIEEKETKESLSEKDKIKSAIITDFVLSIEIVLIALGVVLDKPLIERAIIVTIIAFLATIGVYGLVALIVRLDDMGLKLAQNEPKDSFKYRLGMKMVTALPKIIRVISIIGIFAMLLVAGGIFMHNIHQLHDILKDIPTLLAELITAIAVGGVLMIIKWVVLSIVKLFK